MPSSASHPIDICGLSRAEQLDALGRTGRLAHYERNELSTSDPSIWAARYPDEPPLINDEFAWTCLTLADHD